MHAAPVAQMFAQMFAPALQFWILLVWPDPNACEITVARWPEAQTHREGHAQLEQCWELRDAARAAGHMAACETYRVKVGHNHVLNGRTYHFGGGSGATIGSPNAPRYPGDKVCIWPPFVIKDYP